MLTEMQQRSDLLAFSYDPWLFNLDNFCFSYSIFQASDWEPFGGAV